ncbi:hypothetical protein GBAR_LOCUS15314, partial [Geodia barretti]
AFQRLWQHQHVASPPSLLDGLLGLGVLGGALLVGGVVTAGAVAFVGMGIAKLKK